MEHGKFWIAISDLHESVKNIARIPDADHAEGIIVTGDLTNAGDSKTADRILEQIAEVNPTIYALFGNMDKKGVQTLLQDKNVSIHARGVRLNQSIGLAGVGASLPTPFGTPSEVSDGTLASWLQQAVSEIEHLPRTILATHNPPLNTVADRLSDGRHVGSRKLREFIETSQPQVVLTGHIHEAVGEERIGASKVINPGPLHTGGYVIIQQDGDDELHAKLRRLGN
jgi:Icc-related predicted phosphoesterase